MSLKFYILYSFTIFSYLPGFHLCPQFGQIPIGVLKLNEPVSLPLILTVGTHIYGVHLYPQLPHLFTVFPLPRNPVNREYPREPVVMLVEPHFGHLGTGGL